MFRHTCTILKIQIHPYPNGKHVIIVQDLRAAKHSCENKIVPTTKRRQTNKKLTDTQYPYCISPTFDYA